MLFAIVGDVGVELFYGRVDVSEEIYVDVCEGGIYVGEGVSVCSIVVGESAFR